MKEDKASKSLIRSSSQGLKIPKILLVKSMQKRSHKNNADDFEAKNVKNEKKKRWATNIFPKKMGSIICQVFGKQKPVEPKTLKSMSFREILEIEDKKGGKKKGVCCSRGLKLVRDENNKSVKVMGVNCRKVKRVRSLRNRIKHCDQVKKLEEKVEKDIILEEKKDDEELCKKRILMGGKCRPLNLSGVLHYDKDGILLPEIIP